MLRSLLIVFILCLGTALWVLPATIYRALKKWKSILMQHDYSSPVAQRLVWTAYFSHVFVFTGGALIWIGWTIDVISTYSLALISALIITGLIATFFLKRIKALARQREIRAEK